MHEFNKYEYIKSGVRLAENQTYSYSIQIEECHLKLSYNRSCVFGGSAPLDFLRFCCEA